MLIKLIASSEDVEASDDGWWFRPVIIFILSNGKVLYYHCGRGKLFDKPSQAVERAERFVSLYNRLVNTNPPK